MAMTVSILIVVPLLALVKPLVATQSLDCQLIKVQISDLDMRSYNQKRLKWFALICFDIFFFFLTRAPGASMCFQFTRTPLAAHRVPVLKK